MRSLTPRQAECLAVIRAWIRVHGVPPTLRELGGSMGIKSTNGVNDHLRALERKGFLERDRRRSRGIRLIGQDADGAVLEAIENIMGLTGRDLVAAIELLKLREIKARCGGHAGRTTQP